MLQKHFYQLNHGISIKFAVAQQVINHLKHLRPKNLHPFELLCKKHAIKHKLTKFRHPWTNGQVERINRTIKDATTKTYHYDSINQFEKHLKEFILVYNFAKRLKSLKFKTPFEFLAEKFKNNPTLFYQNPDHYSKGLNTQPVLAVVVAVQELGVELAVPEDLAAVVPERQD